MKKDKWIEEVLHAAKEIQPVLSNPYMATRIEAKLAGGSRTDQLPLRWVYLSAIAIICLVIFNISIWSRGTNSSAASGVQQLAKEYGWESDDLYSVNLSNR